MQNYQPVAYSYIYVAVGAVGSKCLAEKLHVRCIGGDDSESELGAVTFLYVQLDGIGDGCGRLMKVIDSASVGIGPSRQAVVVCGNAVVVTSLSGNIYARSSWLSVKSFHIALGCREFGFVNRCVCIYCI